MFEQPEPTGDALQRRNLRAGFAAVRLAILLVVGYALRGERFAVFSALAVPVFLLLIFGPVLLAGWLGGGRPPKS